MPDKIEIDDSAVVTLRAALRLDEFFPEMSAAEIAKFFPESGVYSYAEKEYVLHQGEAGREVFIVIDGMVTITQMGEAGGSKLGTLESGSVFGEIALAKDGTRTATAIATRASKIFRLAYPDVEALTTANMPFAEHLQALAAKRIEEN